VCFLAQVQMQLETLMLRTMTESSFARWARPVLSLVVIGFAIGLGLPQLDPTWPSDFAANNILGRSPRTALLMWASSTAFVAAVVGLLLLRFDSKTQNRRMQWVPGLVAPAALLAVLPGLLRMNGWEDQLTFSLLLGAFAFGAQALWTSHFHSAEALGVCQRWTNWLTTKPRLTKWTPIAIVVTATAGFAVYMAFYTIQNHYKFNTYNWDLGDYDQEFWNFLHGNPFRNTLLFHEGNWANLRNHVQVTTIVMLPLYALWPKAEGLLLWQAIIVALGAVPIYRFAARRVSSTAGVILALAYLVFPPLHGALFFDFHWQPIAGVLILFAVDAFDTKRFRTFWILFVLAIGCREDISAGTAVAGLWLVMIDHQAKRGLIIFGTSVAYFIALRFFIMPAFGTWGFAEIYKQLFPGDEHNFVGIVKTLVTNPTFVFKTLLTPDKLRYTLQLLAPLAFLPLRRGYLAPLFLPGAFFTIMTTQYAATLEMNFQYSGLFLGYIFPAAALALQSLTVVAERRAALATVVMASLLATAQWGAIPPRSTFKAAYGWIDFKPPTTEERTRLAALEEAARLVPPQAILAASDREIPHVSNRKHCWNLSTGFEGADYVLFTTVNAIPPDIEQGAAAVRAGYIKVFDKAGIKLFRRP
jgi:uncharacterized membrane protein